MFACAVSPALGVVVLVICLGFLIAFPLLASRS